MKTYTAYNILSLDSIEHIRTRPSMYIGDTGLKGFHHLVYEVVDNSTDEALAGFCNEINVIINSDKSITVIDNGRGIPVDFHKKEGCSALEVVMTKIGAGGKFDKNSYKISGGLHGVGISCVNALSSLLFVKVFREGKVFFQEYSRGKSVSKVEQISQSNNPRGTEITFQADENIFKNVSYSYETIAIRLRELSFLERGISINLIDEREISEVGIPRKENFFSEGGLKDFILFIDKNRVPIIPDVIYITGKKEKVSLEVAMRYNHSFDENIHSYVNNINTNEGGTHLTGFRRALTRTFKKYADEYSNKVEITGDDFREGITAIVSVKISHPQFEGQTKTKLGNPEVSGAVEKIVGNYLSKYLEENPRFSRKILEKVLLASKARQAAKKALHKSINNNSISFPGKLADCSLNNPEKCEIYLVEGDSAGGTAKQGRDRNFQAILPLRGKILNVEKSLPYRAFDNEEIRNIFSALGVGTKTDNLNLERLRYHKIIIMTDADTDGSHISTLILTFFFRYMRTLIEKGYIYIATPPLYMIKKGNRKVYAWSDREREKLISEGKKGIIVQRYKGLGEMNSDQLWDTTMNPENRTLRQVNIENLVDTDRIFYLLMGGYVPPRKKFIEMNALIATIDT
jgi:DNA gyrase subunit B